MNIKESIKAILFTFIVFSPIIIPVQCYMIYATIKTVIEVYTNPNGFLIQSPCTDPDWADLHSDIVKEAYRAGNSIKYVWDAR